MLVELDQPKKTLVGKLRNRTTRKAHTNGILEPLQPHPPPRLHPRNEKKL